MPSSDFLKSFYVPRNFDLAMARGPADPVREVFYGNSNFVGSGAGGGQFGLVNASRLGMARQIAEGLDCSCQSFFGEQNVSVVGLSPTDYDGRLILTEGWGADANGVATFGGRFLVSLQSGGRLSFTPDRPWNRFSFYWPQAPIANRALTVRVDEKIIDVIDQCGPEKLQSRSYATEGLGQSISFAADGDGVAYVIGVVARQSLSGQSEAFLGAACGVGSNYLAAENHPWSPLNVVRRINPDRIHIYEMINDCNFGFPADLFQKNMEAILQACPNADIVFYVSYPGGASASATNGLYDSYKRVMMNLLHDIGGGGIIDCRSVLGSSNARAASNGFRFDDDHPSLAGHTAVARHALNILRPK